MRFLGDTSMKVNRVGFGGIPIQRINQTSTNELIGELIKNDINFIDTARGYTVSEKYIGEAIQGKRELFYIATKSMARDYDGMKKDIEISLKDLKTNYIDLYQLHNVKVEELEFVLSDKGAYKALVEAKEQGKINNIGITSHSIETIEKILDTDKFSTIQFPFNIVESQGKEAFKKAKQRGIGTIVMKPLAGGALDDATLAIKYILSKDYIDVVIPGMENIDQVKQNISVLKNTTLTEEDRLNIKEIRNTLGQRFCRRCEYCLPCPKGVNIPTNFLMEGYYTRYNLKEWAKERYAGLSGKAKECIDCGICESRCPYNLPIRKMLKEVSAKLD